MVRVAGLEPARPFGQQIFLLLYVAIAAYCVVVWTMSSPYQLIQGISIIITLPLIYKSYATLMN